MFITGCFYRRDGKFLIPIFKRDKCDDWEMLQIKTNDSTIFWDGRQCRAAIPVGQITDPFLQTTYQRYIVGDSLPAPDGEIVRKAILSADRKLQ